MGAGNVSGHLCVHYATNRHLIFSQGAIPEKQKKAEEMPEKKKRRRSMTPTKFISLFLHAQQPSVPNGTIEGGDVPILPICSPKRDKNSAKHE